jgi:hypothetical protein
VFLKIHKHKFPLKGGIRCFFKLKRHTTRKIKKNKIPKSKLSFQKFHNPWKYNSFNEARQ